MDKSSGFTNYPNKVKTNKNEEQQFGIALLHVWPFSSPSALGPWWHQSVPCCLGSCTWNGAHRTNSKHVLMRLGCTVSSMPKRKECSQTCSSAELRKICKAGHKDKNSSCRPNGEPVALCLAEVLWQHRDLSSIQHLWSIPIQRRWLRIKGEESGQGPLCFYMAQAHKPQR